MRPIGLGRQPRGWCFGLVRPTSGVGFVIDASPPHHERRG